MILSKMVCMKKILSVVAIISILCCFAACNNTSENVSSNDSTAESVSENISTAEKDLGLTGGTCEFSNVVMDIPGGFVSQNDSETFTNYVTEKYPEERDCISFSKSAETIADYSEQNLNKLMQQLNERAERNIYSDEGCIDYKQFTIDGHNAVTYKSEITADDTFSMQTQVVVFFDDGAVIISFSSLSGDYDEVFEKSIESIRVNE